MHVTKLMTLEESRQLEDSPSTSHAYWYEALAGTVKPTHPDYVPLGFFRKSQKDGTSIPVAIYLHEGVKYVQNGNYRPEALATPKAEAEFGRNVFAWFASKAITHEAYQHWKQKGEWPPLAGTDAVIEASLKPKPRPAPKAAPKATPTPKAEPAPQGSNQPPAGIGHNSGADAIEFETIDDQIRSAVKGVAAASLIDSDEKAGAAQSLRSRLTELAKEADAKREVEKAPHLAASRAVDDKWQPRIKEAREAARTLVKAMEAHENAKLRAQREREREAKAAAQAEADAAAAASRVTVTSAKDPVPEVAPAPEPKTAAKPTRIGGAYGRATSAKVKQEIDTIDFRAVCDQLVDTNTELQALLRKMAERIIAAGGTVKGVTTRDVAKIR
jgi:hypothetical protein